VTSAEWLAHVREQLDWLWTAVLRPRFEGLTDDEYLWEPAPGCWWTARSRPGGTAWTRSTSRAWSGAARAAQHP
jgi:hypothetical protein